MLIARRRVGMLMHLKFHWMHRNLIIYIVLDNAEGYGIDLCVE